MPKKFLPQILFTLIFGITISNGANLASELLKEDQETPSTQHKFTCLPDEGRASYKALMEQNPYQIDEAHFSKYMMATATTPSKVNLSPDFPPPFNQDILGSCTASALISVLFYDMKKQGIENPEMKSVLYLYYWERFLEGTVNYDTGASLSDSITALKKFGVCSESLWPYQIRNYMVRPPKHTYIDAIKFRNQLNTNRISSVSQKLFVMKTLLSRGSPFVGGIKIYESLESKNVEKTGIVNLPKKNEKSKGSHAVVFAGYNDEINGGSFLILNSWGPNWGTSFDGTNPIDGSDPIRGYFWLPYEYATNHRHAHDFWTFNNLPLLENEDSPEKDSCFKILFKKLSRKRKRVYLPGI
ncbi:MAG: C1 family peptidase [Proteobacteria bacterium]|nr:C1 family peptidase [Pseudomonadota bacterium]